MKTTRASLHLSATPDKMSLRKRTAVSMNLSCSTAMLITLFVRLSYAWAVAYFVVNSSGKIAEHAAAVTSHWQLPHQPFRSMEQERTLLRARMHASGFYVFCPHCGLSFRHPAQIEGFYHIGYGWCWHCLRWSPIEGGDKKGIVKVDERGELYTEFYDEKDKEKAMQRARWVEELCRPKRRGED